MATTLFVEAAVLGRKKPLLSGFSLDLPAVSGGTQPPTLAALIEQVVRLEVQAFQDRQESSRLALVLSPDQIRQQAETGRILSGERPPGPPVDPQQAVRTALQAFEDGLYFVFVDGSQVKSLTDQVHLEEGSSLRFVRLTALAGG